MNQTGTVSGEPGAENYCQTNTENLEKKCLRVRQRLSLYTGEEIQNTFILMPASDPGQPAIWTGKAST